MHNQDVARVFDCTDPTARSSMIATAAAALRRGRTAVAPDEAMYTLICDAFSSDGVAAIRRIKGRSQQPLSVLVGRPVTVDGVAAIIPAYARDLMAAFWPGPLTLLLRQQPSLTWPLRSPGIAVRMPLHPVLLELVRELGPTAASSANVAGMPPVTSPAAFHEQLADDPDIFLDCGEMATGTRSTVIDATGDRPVIKRSGGFDDNRIAEVCPEAVTIAG